MYYEHFGLTQPPFKITPDTRLFYEGGKRGDILEALAYVILSGEGIVKVVGEVGSGKTMLSRMLDVRLPEHVDIVYFANPSLAPRDVLYAIALEMKIELPRDVDRIHALHMLQETLLERHAQGRQVVCFVEEAQSMPLETLEEIRLLSNLETHVAKLLQIVLFGQPELDDNLDQQSIRQLRERIVHSFYLDPLGSTDLSSYVSFRMRSVGYRGPDVFTRGAYKALAKASEGLIRRVNILGDKALLAAYADNSHQVTEKHVRTAVKDSEFGRSARKGGRRRGAGIAAGLVVTLAAGWLLGSGKLTTQQQVSESPKPRGSDTPLASAALASETSPARAPSAPREPVPQAAPEVAQPQAVAEVAQPQALSEAVQPQAVAEIAQPQALSEAVQPVAETLAASSQTPGTPAAPAMPRVPQFPDNEARIAQQIEAATRESSQPSSLSVLSFATDTLTVPSLSAPAPIELQSIAPPDTRVSGTDGAIASTPGANAATATTRASEPIAGAKVISGARLLEQRLSATVGWLSQANQDSFSIQLMLANQNKQANLERFLEGWQAGADIQDLYIYRTTIRGSVWYAVLLGQYPSIQAAKAVLDGLPEGLKRHKPFVRNVRDISALTLLHGDISTPMAQYINSPLPLKIRPSRSWGE
jgi:MSHA biogenesis protein MshM